MCVYTVYYTLYGQSPAMNHQNLKSFRSFLQSRLESEDGSYGRLNFQTKRAEQERAVRFIHKLSGSEALSFDKRAAEPGSNRGSKLGTLVSVRSFGI